MQAGTPGTTKPYTLEFADGTTLHCSHLQMAKLCMWQKWTRFDGLYLQVNHSAALQRKDEQIVRLETELALLNDITHTSIEGLKQQLAACECEKLRLENEHRQQNREQEAEIERLRKALADKPPCDCEKLNGENRELLKRLNSCQCDILKRLNTDLQAELDALKHHVNLCEKLKRELQTVERHCEGLRRQLEENHPLHQLFEVLLRLPATPPARPPARPPSPSVLLSRSFSLLLIPMN